MFTKPENMKVYWKEFMHQCVEIGIGALGIVVIISVFMGCSKCGANSLSVGKPHHSKSTIAQIVRDTLF
ncbi:MAG: hypothetical protein WDM90_02605 [Ferruginibacter sp.]